MIRPPKYRNTKVQYDGHKFDSKAECERYKELKLLEKYGQIRDLELQKRFHLHCATVNATCPNRVSSYVADFCYDERTDEGRWRWVVEDVKGKRTDIYRLKKKWMKLEYGIEIREVHNGRVV